MARMIKADEALNSVSQTVKDQARPALAAVSVEAPFSSDFEDISNPSNGVDQLHFEGIVHFHAQTSHMNVNHVGIAFEIDVPDPLRDAGTQQHLAGAAGKEREQREFLRCEVDALAGTGDPVGGEIDFQVAHLEHLGSPGRSAPQDGVDARQKFREGKRFHQIIVGSKLQPPDPVLHGV